MKKLLVLLALCMVLSVVMVACTTEEAPADETTAGEVTEAPTNAETEAPTQGETEAPTESETEAPTETETETDAPTTETETEPETEPEPDPVKVGMSFDECDPWTGDAQGTAFFTPGQSASWDKVAVVEDYNVSAIRVWGWVAFFAETPGTFGYQIGDADPVFDAAFSVEAEQPVIDAAHSQGGKSAARMRISIPVEFLSGEEITIKAVAMDAAGTIETLVEFKLTKPVNPNAPVFFVTAGEMASSIPGSPDVASATMSADGQYITITTGTVGDPYYQLPMINQKGYQAGFIAIKYRTTVEIGGQIFIGSGAGPNGQGDCPTFDYVSDGKWNLVIIPLEGVASITEAGINYLRWDMFQRGTENSIDMAYIAAFNSAEAALAYDAKVSGALVDTYNVPQDVWGVSGHKEGVTPAEDPTHGAMVAAGGIATGALLHQGAIYIGDLNLAEFSKITVSYGIDNSQVTIDHYNAATANRIMLTNVDTHLTNSPAEENIVASVNYTLEGWALYTIEIDLTGVDYNGPVYVTYDTLPGTFMLVGAIELTYDKNYVEPAAPAEDPYFALKMTQAQEGVDYYFTGAMAGEYLATSTNAADAAKVFVETHEEGLRQYVLVDGVKNYIELHFNDSNKVRVCMTTEPTQYYVFNEEANTYVINFNDNNYYLGTYNAFTTIGCSTTYYITGDNAANVGVSQYVVEWVEYTA